MTHFSASVDHAACVACRKHMFAIRTGSFTAPANSQCDWPHALAGVLELGTNIWIQHQTQQQQAGRPPASSRRRGPAAAQQHQPPPRVLPAAAPTAPPAAGPPRCGAAAPSATRPAARLPLKPPDVMTRHRGPSSGDGSGAGVQCCSRCAARRRSARGGCNPVPGTAPLACTACTAFRRLQAHPQVISALLQSPAGGLRG